MLLRSKYYSVDVITKEMLRWSKNHDCNLKKLFVVSSIGATSLEKFVIFCFQLRRSYRFVENDYK